jgi:hypothetical protein
MTTSVPVKTSKKQTVVRKDLLKVRVASHFSRAGATPEPTGQPANGKRDPAEQRRWGAGKPVIGATVSVQGTKASAITDKGGRATLDLGGVLDANERAALARREPVESVFSEARQQSPLPGSSRRLKDRSRRTYPRLPTRA